MIQFEAVITLFSDLGADELTFWIERRWVRPERANDTWVFHDIDVARVRLIYDLRRDFDASEDALELLLSLIDQVYELRRNMTAMKTALESQPREVRQAVLKALPVSPAANEKTPDA